MSDDPVIKARADLEQLTAVTLPKIYREIGRRVSKSPKVPAALKHHFDAIARLKPAADAQDAAATAQLREAYAALGQEAVTLFGEKAIPKDIAPLLTDALARQKACSAVLHRGPVDPSLPENPLGQATSDYVTPPPLVKHEIATDRAPRRYSSKGYILLGGVAVITVVCITAGIRWSQFSREGRSVNNATGGASPESGSATLAKAPAQSRAVYAARGKPANDPFSQVVAGNAGLRTLVADAVTRVMGPQADFFKGSSFKGIRLGSECDYTRAEYQGPASKFVIPKQAVEPDPRGRFCDVSMLVAAKTKRVVGIHAYYPEDRLQDMASDIAAVFGKPLQEVDTFEQFVGGLPRRTTLIKYTFPSTVVRVAGGAHGVTIQVIDIDFLVEHLHRYANFVAVSSAWMSDAIDTVADPSKRLDKMPTIGNCIFEADDEGRAAIWYDKQQRERYRKAVQGRQLFLGCKVVQCFDLAGVWMSNTAAVSAVDPMACATLELGELASNGWQDGAPPTLADEWVGDLFWDVASTILQKTFPPAGESISVLRPNPDGPDGVSLMQSGRGIITFAPDARPSERLSILSQRWFCDRYEWTDTQSRYVRVARNLSFCVTKPKGRGL